jgi:hypothetical protein
MGIVVDPNWRDYFGLGTQHPGEEYLPIPDEIRIANEAHSVFLTLDDTFYRQTYVRLRAVSIEVLNGRVMSEHKGTVDLDTFALDPREVVASVESGAPALPAFTVRGEPARVVIAGG